MPVRAASAKIGMSDTSNTVRSVADHGVHLWLGGRCLPRGIEVCNQRGQVGMTQARKIVTVEVDQTVLRTSTPPAR